MRERERKKMENKREGERMEERKMLTFEATIKKRKKRGIFERKKEHPKIRKKRRSVSFLLLSSSLISSDGLFH